MVGDGRMGEAKAWEQLPDERPVAYQAFVTYRDLGARRSLAETGRVLGKHESLMRRWARRHQWRRRVLAWDRAQARDDEVALRQERDEIRRRELPDADRLERLAMAKMMSLVHRDPVTGASSLAPEVTPQIALHMYRLASSITRSMSAADENEDASPRHGDLWNLKSDAELAEVIKLAEERASQGAEVVQNGEDEAQEETGDEGEDDDG